MTVQEKTNF